MSRIYFKKKKKKKTQQLIKDGYRNNNKKRNLKIYKTLDKNRLIEICDFKFKDTIIRHRKLVTVKKVTSQYKV